MNRKTILIVSIYLVAIIISQIYYQNYSTSEEELKVIIDGKEYPDSFFDEKFDYSTLRDKKVEITMYLDSKEFPYNYEKFTFEYKSIDKAWLLLDELKAPKIVIGFSKFLCMGSFNETVLRFYGEDYSREVYGEEVGGVIGTAKKSYYDVLFQVYRLNIPNMKGLQINKMYGSASSWSSVWSLFIDLESKPDVIVTLQKYPRK